MFIIQYNYGGIQLHLLSLHVMTYSFTRLMETKNESYQILYNVLLMTVCIFVVSISFPDFGP